MVRELEIYFHGVAFLPYQASFCTKFLKTLSQRLRCLGAVRLRCLGAVTLRCLGAVTLRCHGAVTFIKAMV